MYSKIRRFVPFLLIAGVLAASLPAYAGSSNRNKAPKPEAGQDCAKIEGADLGIDGITMQLDGVTVTVTDWTTKPGEAGEYTGFTYTSDSFATALTIKAGTYRHQISGGNGTFQVPQTGDKLHAVSHVEACAVSFEDIVS